MRLCRDAGFPRPGGRRGLSIRPRIATNSGVPLRIKNPAILGTRQRLDSTAPRPTAKHPQLDASAGARERRASIGRLPARLTWAICWLGTRVGDGGPLARKPTNRVVPTTGT
jgi:hypothetical protein